MAVRGSDVANPVLLFLHGGPGTPETPFLFRFNRRLSDHFTLVAWEQRGAGRSYSRRVPPESMNLTQFVKDAHEVTRYLRKRFERQQIYLAGHSWGALIGILAAEEAPDDYHAYIGISQPTDFARSLIVIRRWILEMAKATRNRSALRELARLGEPIGGQFAHPRAAFATQMKWVGRFGGALVETSWARLALQVFLPTSVYSLADKLRYLAGARSSAAQLMEDVRKRNLFAEVPELALPVYFIHGRSDMQVPCALTEEYVRTLEAPLKRFFVLEHSAHGALYEEPERFRQILVDTILPETRSPSP